MNLAEGKMFVRNANNIIDVFGEEAFAKGLEGFELHDFSTFEYVPEENTGMIQHYEKMGYPVLAERVRHCVRETHYCGGKEWERYADKICKEFRVRSIYQNNEHKLLRAILEEQFPYIRFFVWDIYHLDTPDDDIYLQCESGPLYVPVKAIVAGNWQMILDRHNGYHNGYYGGRPECKEHLAKALSIPESYTARLFKACMEVKRT